MKRILTVQDISCVGKCSLTVALPIISAMGIETAVLPTAVLSTHTAFEKGFTFRDLTQDIEPISTHWKKEGITFDAIYTGYLGSFEQLHHVSQLFDDFRTENSLVFVDPVMGDFGKLYTGFTPAFAKEMATLCGKADIIVPNMTEACFLLGIPYVESGYDKAYVQNILKKLTDLGAPCAVLTGVSFDESSVGVMAYNSKTNQFFEYDNKRVPASFHGTGDIFASTCVGGLVNGLSLADALQVAADYTAACILETEAEENHNWYGVNFETVIPTLLKLLFSKKTS